VGVVGDGINTNAVDPRTSGLVFESTVPHTKTDGRGQCHLDMMISESTHIHKTFQLRHGSYCGF
jgi:hypothetical protein